jgi:hypothetical protein
MGSKVLLGGQAGKAFVVAREWWATWKPGLTGRNP